MSKNKNLTISELALAVESTLLNYHLLQNQPDRRVSAAPDARTIRYYTTLGLLARPVIINRQARYQSLHVFQLAVIKLYQFYGLSLSDIQARLSGKTERELEHILKTISNKIQNETKIQPIVWNEVTIQPGLKILVEENWSHRDDLSNLTDKIGVILEALSSKKQLKEG